MNTEVYQRPEVVDFYDRLSTLLPCEELLFGDWVRKGASVLDLGVGAGRTTPFLAARAGRYLGVDVVQEMVDRCRLKHPSLEFLAADASALNEVADASVDAVVFSFNGVDHLSEGARPACFRELYRVLKPGGALIFSTHHSRYCLVYPDLRNASAAQKIWRICRAPVASLKTLKRLLQKPFWRGHGSFWEETHGGAAIYAETPELTRKTVTGQGFRHAVTLPSTYPSRPWSCFVPFYYHVFLK